MANTRCAALPGGHEAGALEQPQMLGNRGTTGPEISGDFPDGTRTLPKQAQDLAPRRVRDGTEDELILRAGDRNHSVTQW